MWVVVGFWPVMFAAAIVFAWRHRRYVAADDLRRADDEPAADPADQADQWVWRSGSGIG